MSERSRQSDMRVRKSVKSRKELPLVERRALPTRERLRRAGPDFERGDTGQITMRDSPLERAFARNALTPEQYSAGQKYRHHWYHAGLADRLESIDLNRIFAIDVGAYSGMAKTTSRHFTALQQLGRFQGRVQLVTATPLVVYRQEFRIPRSSVDVD